MRPNEVGELTYNPPNEAKTAIAKILRFWTRPAYTCISWAHRVRSISTHPDAPARALRRAMVRFVPTASPAIVGKLREKFGFWQSSYTRTSPGRPGRVFLVCENCEKFHNPCPTSWGHNITSLLRSHPHDVTVWSPRDSNRRDSWGVWDLEFICRESNLLDYWEWIWFNLFILN